MSVLMVRTLYIASILGPLTFGNSCADDPGVTRLQAAVSVFQAAGDVAGNLQAWRPSVDQIKARLRGSS